MKPLFQIAIAPRLEYLSDLGHRLHVAEERARVRGNICLAISGCALVACVVVGIAWRRLT